jgi:hypothetical protein
MLHTSLAAAALAATAVAIAGCGGSSKTGSTATSAASTSAQTSSAQTNTPTATSQEIKLQSGTPLSRGVWIAEGDAICARANIHRHAQTAKTDQEIARLAPQVSGYDHIEATELSKLVPPTAKAKDWRVIVTDAQKLSELTARFGEYAQTNKIHEAQPMLIAAANVQQQLTTIAQRDGFKICSTQ